MKYQVLNMLEWESKFIPDVVFPNKDDQDIIEVLNKSKMITIEELKDGTTISSNSFVGIINIGNMQIQISPKIKGMPLYNLLKYAYGLTNLTLFDSVEHAINSLNFFDLIIYELCQEADNLIRKGVHKSYQKEFDDLASPRGRIDFNTLSRQGGVKSATLPCVYHNRSENNIVNQTMLSGLNLALTLTGNAKLKAQIKRLCKMLEEQIDSVWLTWDFLLKAESGINRLTERYRGLIDIVKTLYELKGIELESENKKITLPGYLFDMNLFFERLISKLLSDFTTNYIVHDQHKLRFMYSYAKEFNPLKRNAPKPRPDFALTKDKKVIKLLDAKYRDLWERELPTYMLYQLSIYAMSGVGDKTSTILYPSLNKNAVIQKIDINTPLADSKMGAVILQPVDLNKVSELLDKPKELYGYVNHILNINAS